VLTTLKNAWGITELRKKILFTLLVLLLYRIGNVIPVPYINVDALRSYYDAVLSTTILGLYNAMSGSAFSQATVLALSIQPYINASIIVQLLTIAIPALERMAKEEGEEGKKKINLITRYSTVGLGLLMGWAYYVMLSNAGIVTEKGFLPAMVIILTFTAGSAVVMWLGEQINEHGIGNGISMILFANIISSVPATINTLFSLFTAKTWWQPIVIVIGMAALVLFIIFINDAERRIPVQYAKRVVGRKVYGGQSTNLPIKVAMSGVMPVIFAQSICSLPATFCAFIPSLSKSWANEHLFASNTWPYIVVYFLMIFFFGWFYAAIQYDPVEIGNNLKNNGGFIPGFRPGRPTSEFIQKVINKIIIFGSLYLGIVALLPMIGGILMPSVNYLAIGGTSIIIVVGVALETVQALEAQMMMRHYKGFLD
jgi:preprotein translocase subunit SecY